jgi:two-component system, chemotaxis family, chemotaxis protein CheY
MQARGDRRVAALLPEMVVEMPGVETKQRNFRVLMIEDDEDDVFLFRRALDAAKAELGLEVACERIDNGLDALYLVTREDLTENLPDALVLDLNMPRLDGLKFLKSLRCSLRLKAIPVFVLTTTSAPSIHEEAMGAGANKVYVKPNDSGALHAIATEILTALAR